MQQPSPDPSGQRPSRRSDVFTNAGPLGAGLTMIATVALFALAGHWLDEKLVWSSPLFLLLGFGLGAVGGFLHLVNAVAPELLPFRRRKRKAPPEPGDRDGDGARS